MHRTERNERDLYSPWPNPPRNRGYKVTAENLRNAG
jgi:hypothetical protein